MTEEGKSEQGMSRTVKHKPIALLWKCEGLVSPWRGKREGGRWEVLRYGSLPPLNGHQAPTSRLELYSWDLISISH